jgi:hypothetical protein
VHAVGGQQEREAAGLALAVVGGQRGVRGGEGTEQAMVVKVRRQEAVLVEEETEEVPVWVLG